MKKLLLILVSAFLFSGSAVFAAESKDSKDCCDKEKDKGSCCEDSAAKKETKTQDQKSAEKEKKS